MKAHNPIDDMFQQHFADASVPMNNQEELWQRISEKKANKRKRTFWFGSLGLIVCVVVGFGLINLNNNTDQELLSNRVVGSTESNTTPNNIENSQVIVAGTNSDREEAIVQKTSNVIPKIEVAIRKSRNASPLVSEEVILSNGDPRNRVKESIPFREVRIDNELSDNTISNSMAPAIVDKKISDSDNIEIKENANKLLNLEVVDLNIESINLASNSPLGYKTDPWSKCEVKTPGRFFVDAYGQGGLSLDDIDFSKVGTDQTVYRDLWDTRFDTKATWHGGVQMGYEFDNRLRISAGAEYQEIITEYSNNLRITETVRVYDPEAFFTIDMNGDQVWVGDTVTAINIYERKFVRKNTHTLLHIPFQISYDIYKKPGFHVAVEAAVAINVSKTFEGQYIRSDQTLIRVDEDNQDNYISKDIGMSFSVGLHAGKYLNDNWEVYASPRFRYNPNSYLVDTETLKISRNLIGLRAGVRYHF